MATNTRDWGLIHLGKHYYDWVSWLREEIETLGRIRQKTYSCNPLISPFVRLLIIIVKRRAALSPRLGQLGPNWVNKFFCVLSSFLSCCFLLLACVYNCSMHFVFWLFDYSLLHTSSLLLVWFFHRIHNNWRPPWGKDQRIIKYYGFEVGYWEVYRR